MTESYSNLGRDGPVGDENDSQNKRSSREGEIAEPQRYDAWLRQWANLLRESAERVEQDC